MNILAKIRRRGFVSGVLSGIAAAALANVARAQTPDPVSCQLGPAPHDKGPLVCMDMDQIELETPEFQRQGRDFALAVKAAGKRIELIEAPNYHHYENGRVLWKPLRPERPRSARPDAAADSRIGREQFTGPHAI